MVAHFTAKAQVLFVRGLDVCHQHISSQYGYNCIAINCIIYKLLTYYKQASTDNET